MPNPPAAHSLAFDQVMQQIHDLPTLPVIVQDLLKSIDSDDADIHLITRKVSQDQALSAKVLRFANSSFYGVQSRVTTIQQAITLIGIDAVKHMASASTLTRLFPSEHLAGLDFTALWRHSVATAVCARVLARHLHVNQDYAFTAGLMHDIGRLVLVIYFRDQYQKVLAYREEQDSHLIEAERDIMGIDYVMTGVALATHWNFSDSIRNAIAGHYRPENQKVHSLASIVHIANAIVHALDLSRYENDLVPPLSQAAWDDLALSEETYLRVFHETEVMFEEIGRILLTDD